MPRPILCLVTDAARGRADLVRTAVGAGVDWVQLRDRSLGGADLLEAGRGFLRAMDEGAAAAADSAAERSPRTLLVNRRLDVALALLEDAPVDLRVGLHLGFDAPPLAAALATLSTLGAVAGPVGVASHDVGEFAAAAGAGAGYAHLAPIFAPLSKPASRPPLGTAALGDASQVSGGASNDNPRCLLIAQGGIQGERAGEAIRAGADGVAVTGAILAAADPGDAAARLRATLDQAQKADGAPRSG